MSIAQQWIVQPILEDFELRISRVIDAAWGDWRMLPVSVTGLLSKRSRASFVFDFIRHRAVLEFANDGDINIQPKGQTVKFLFKGQVLARFKKANSKGIGSNIPTQAVLEFVNPQYPLFELPPLHHIDICYEENALATNIESITVNARQLYRRIWSYQMQRPSAAIVQIITPAADDSGGGEAIVRPREEDGEAKADDTGSLE